MARIRRSRGRATLAAAAAVAVAAGVTTAAPPAAAQEDEGPPNLVSNGDFAPPVADQWWGIDDDQVSDGEVCVDITATERFGNFVDLDLAEGETYSFGFTAHGDPGTDGLEARIQSDASTGDEVFDLQETFAPDGEATAYEWTFDASGDAQRVQFEFAGATQDSTVCISDVVVSPITELLQNPGFDDGLDPWWSTDNLDLEADEDGRMCGTVPGGGEQWDVIVGQGGIAIEEGATYTVTLTATGAPESSARILVPDPETDWPPLYYADVTLRPDGQSFTETFEAEAGADTEFQLQLGGNAEDFDLCLELASLTTGGEVEEFEHETGPRVRVNQVGYLPHGPKNATLVTEAEDALAWELRDDAGEAVATGETTPAGHDDSAGLDVHTIDFSHVEATGTDFRLAADGEESYPFAIHDEIYADLRRDALGIYYSARSGMEITAIEADGELHKEEYERPAGHVSEFGGDDVNQGDLAVPCLPNEGVTDHQGNSQAGGYEHYGEDGWDCPEGYTLDVTGGWYDAGDHGKYVVNSGISVYQLLSSYERSQHAGVVDDGALGDSTLYIPERGNDVPDILDEVKWNLDWMLSMQVPEGTEMGIGGETIDAGGLVHHKVHDVAWTGLNMLPHEDPMPRYLHRPSTAATLNLAAAAAQGARAFAEHDPAYADELRAAAERAWDAAHAHPEIYAPNTNNLDANPGGGPYNDTELGDESYWAAAQMFLTTQGDEYRDAVLDSPYHVGGEQEDIWGAAGFGWSYTAPAARLDLALVPNHLPDRDAVIDSVVEGADQYLATQDGEPFGHPYNPGGYDWGSSHQVINNAVVIATAYDLTGEEKYLAGGLEAIDYLLGRNAINNSYVKGYGTYYSENMHSRWYASADRLPPFPDGKLAGGPNSGIQDPVAQENLQGCAPQACYIDDNGSWSTNETTINWNAALAWYASWLDDMADSAPDWSPTTRTCEVTYTVHGSWPGGFNAQLWLENLGPGAVDGWTLSWDFPDSGTVVEDSWNAEVSQSGTTVTVENPQWAPELSAPDEAEYEDEYIHDVGFVGEAGGDTPPVPETVTLNGVSCAVTQG